MRSLQPAHVYSQAVANSTGIFGSVKRLGFNSGIYALGNLLTRGLVFLLVPVLTRALTPDEYGIFAITTAVSNLVAMLFGLGLDGAITRLYFRYNTAREHCSLYGTLLIFWLVVPTLATLLLGMLGRAGVLDVFPAVPFHPYFTIAIWAGYFSLFTALPQAIYRTLRQPLKVMGLAVPSSLLTVGLSIYLVVYRRQGIMGSLRATLVSALVMAVVAIFLTVRMASWDFSWSKLKVALVFSLPSVPHMMSQWALSFSDRLILARYVSAESLGLYSLGYQVGALVVLFSGSVMNEFTPLITAQLSDGRTEDKVPPLGTYALLGITSIGLGVALFGEDLIWLTTPARFQAAGVVVPWIALAYVFHGVYLIWSSGTWFSMRTTWIPFLTILAGGFNIGLNFWLVPSFGIMAAALNTVAAYGLLAVMHGYLAQKLHPIPWEYARWVKILVMAPVCFVIAATLSGGNWIYDLLLKISALFALFPASLILVGFLTPAESQFLLSLPDRLRGRRRFA